MKINIGDILGPGDWYVVANNMNSSVQNRLRTAHSTVMEDKLQISLQKIIYSPVDPTLRYSWSTNYVYCVTTSIISLTLFSFYVLLLKT